MGLTEPGDGTRCVRAGSPEPVPGQPFLAGPVFAATYHLGPGAEDGYGRASNPTWRALEAAIGELDGGECVLFPSGMGALATLLRTATRDGDTVLLPEDGYYLARRLFGGEVRGLHVRTVPTLGPWTAGTLAGVRLVLVETPSNPGMD